MSCLTLLCLWFSCELWRQSTNQDVSVHSLSLLYTLTVSLHNFWVHNLGCWPASEPCLRRAALVLVPKNVEESQSRKDMQKLRPNSTSFLIPKKVKEDVRWRGLPGQRAMSGRRCLMCVPRMLFKNNVWTEQHGNGSSPTYFKPLMLSWFVCFVKIGFYMIGQAKHALVVGTLSKLQLMLGTGMPRHRCSRKGCPAYINPHHLPTCNLRWWKRYRSHSSANTVCFALSVAQWHLAPCHPSRSPHQPQGHWGHGEQAEPSSRRLGLRRRRNPSSLAMARLGLTFKQMRLLSQTQTWKIWPTTLHSRSSGNNGAALFNEVLHRPWFWQGWLPKRLPGERLVQARSGRWSGNRLLPSTYVIALSSFTQMRPSRPNWRWVVSCVIMSGTAKSVSKSRASGYGNCPRMFAWPRIRIQRLIANSRSKGVRKLSTVPGVFSKTGFI